MGLGWARFTCLVLVLPEGINCVRESTHGFAHWPCQCYDVPWLALRSRMQLPSSSCSRQHACHQQAWLTQQNTAKHRDRDYGALNTSSSSSNRNSAKADTAPGVQARRASDGVAALPTTHAQQPSLRHVLEAEHADAELRLACDVWTKVRTSAVILGD